LRLLSRTLLASALLAGILTGCAGGEMAVDPPPPPASGFAAVQSIFTGNCAFSGCHAGASPQQGMDLSAGRSYDNIVGVAAHEVPRLLRVAPNNPDSSYLLIKLEGEAGSVGGVGTQMPLGGMLSQAQVNTVRDWIASGALRR